MSRADSGRLHSNREELISRAFVTLADTLVDDYDVIELLDRLVGFGVQLLPADAAGIVLGDARRELRAVAASERGRARDGVVAAAEPTKARAWTASRARHRCRWPTWPTPPIGGRPSRRRSTQRGNFRSVHALPLRLRGRAIGALNLFRAVPGPLPEADLALGQALADVATIGILQERAIHRGEVVNEQLQLALNSRLIIEQAKGVLAQYGGLGPAAAFDSLRHYARSHNVKLDRTRPPSRRQGFRPHRDPAPGQAPHPPQ